MAGGERWGSEGRRAMPAGPANPPPAEQDAGPKETAVPRPSGAGTPEGRFRGLSDIALNNINSTKLKTVLYKDTFPLKGVQKTRARC